jgi:hypothetical protein
MKPKKRYKIEAYPQYKKPINYWAITDTKDPWFYMCHCYYRPSAIKIAQALNYVDTMHKPKKI